MTAHDRTWLRIALGGQRSAYVAANLAGATTFAPTTSTWAPERAIRDVVARAGTTIEEAIPKLHAYLLGVEPDRRPEALRSLRLSSAVASASQELISEAIAGLDFSRLEESA